ncbi:MAG: hypothetical protein MI862_04285, partial [Desulfobacterales bacterium]|nr:hypothetical protein [Desulfobacterales bacterium]
MRVMTGKKILGLLLFLLVFLLFSPHILAEKNDAKLQPYGGYQDTALLEEFADNNIFLSLTLEDLQNYFLSLDPELKESEFSNLDLDILNVTFSDKGETILETPQGKIVGKFALLPYELMELVLYQKDKSEGVFGLLDNYDESKDSSEQYSVQARSKILDQLTVFYGYDALKELNVDQSLLEGKEPKFVTQNAGLEFLLMPGVLLNADFKQTVEGTGETMASKTLQLALNPSSYASFNAGLEVISENGEKLDAQFWPVFLTSLVGNDAAELDEVVIRQMGLALKPSDFTKVFADYVTTSGQGDENSAKTVFGLHFGDTNKALDATYQMENSENATTTATGVKLGFVDLATLEAVYSKIADNQLSEEALKSIIDLGLDVSLNSDSVLRFQYQWILPEEMEPED